MARVQQIEFELPGSPELRHFFPLRRDFSACTFRHFLHSYDFELRLGPSLLDVKRTLAEGEEVLYPMVTREDGSINRRASLARALTMRSERQRLARKGELYALA